MIPSIWEDIKDCGHGGFSQGENWGEPENVNGFILTFLFMVRLETGWPIVIHNAKENTGHSPNSQHYVGNAVDWHFVTDEPYRVQVDRLMNIAHKKQMSEFMGIGIYPHWNNPGFHTDCRGSKARWGYIKKNGKQSQVSWNDAYNATE